MSRSPAEQVLRIVFNTAESQGTVGGGTVKIVERVDTIKNFGL